MGVWAMATSDKAAITALTHPAHGKGNLHLGAVCNHMNSFLHYYGMACLAEAVITCLLAWSMWNIMKNANWGCFSLCNMALYVAVFVAKSGFLVMGVLYVWGLDTAPCHAVTPKLYKGASIYLTAALVVFGVQIILGSVYLLLCGLMDALHEAINNIKEEWMGDTGEPDFGDSSSFRDY
jgi:hypothetical protein